MFPVIFSFIIGIENQSRGILLLQKYFSHFVMKLLHRKYIHLNFLSSNIV